MMLLIHIARTSTMTISTRRLQKKSIVRSLETAATRTMRPRANNELGKKRKRTDIERHRPPPGLPEKLPARTPQSILVTYNKTKTREKQVRPEDNPGSWVWYSNFKSLYTFEQKHLSHTRDQFP